MAVSTVAGIGLVAGSIFQGQRERREQRRAVRRQEAAQRQATQRAATERRRSEQEQRRLNRRRPQIPSLLGQAGRAAQGGPAGTLLTGPGGIGRGQLTLGGGGSLLGG